MPLQESLLIFVYGTLRTEYGAIGHHVAQDKVRGLILDLGGCPGAYHLPEEDYPEEALDRYIVGEVLEITPHILPDLDRYEGVSEGLYSRISVKTHAGRECFMYQINPRFLGQAPIIRSGDWFDREETQEALVKLVQNGDTA